MLIDPPAVPVRPLFDIQLTRQPYTSIDLPCRGVVLWLSGGTAKGTSQGWVMQTGSKARTVRQGDGKRAYQVVETLMAG